MKVTVDSKKGLKTNLKVFIDKKTIEEKIVIRLNELSKEVTLKGFRPGKVPVKVLKDQFGKNIYGEVLEKVLNEYTTKAIEEKKIKVAGQPKINIKSHGEGKDLNYTIEVDELPKVQLKSLENIKFTDYEINVTEQEIKKRIEDLAKNQSNFKEKPETEISEKGDLISFDYEATIENKKFEGGEGKNTQIVIGKDLFIKGFDKQLIGVKKKQEKEIIATLPENFPNKEFANKKANFKCKILNIKKPEAIKIDDQFAKNLGAKDLSDLKKILSTQIQNQYKINLDAISKENILNQIDNIHKVELPDNLVQQELSLITQGLKQDEIDKSKKESEKIAKKRIKLGLILKELGEKNNIKVDDQEINNEIQKDIKSMPNQEKQILEFYQKNPSAAANLRGAMYEDKIIKLIKQKSKQIKKTISIQEAEKIIKAESDDREKYSKIEKSNKNKKKISKK